MKLIKKPLIDTLLREGVTPPQGASLKKLIRMLNDNGWYVELSIKISKTTTTRGGA